MIGNLSTWSDYEDPEKVRVISLSQDKGPDYYFYINDLYQIADRVLYKDMKAEVLSTRDLRNLHAYKSRNPQIRITDLSLNLASKDSY